MKSVKKPIIGISLLAAVLLVFTSCDFGGGTVKAETPKPKKRILTEELMPDQILDPEIFPLFSDLYKGGIKVDSDAKVYIWNGCRMQTLTNEDYYEPTDYWKVSVNPGVDWFGWGIHHYPSGGRDLRGFENGYLHFALKSTPKSGSIKIGIKSGYAYESWIALTNGLYGFEYDNEWHVVNIPFRSFLPSIKFGSINAYFMFAQQTNAVFGSSYHIDQILYVKNTNIEVKNIDVEAIYSNRDAASQE